MSDKTNNPPAATIRTARFADGEGIRRLHERNGLGTFDTRLWRSNWEAFPFARDFRDLPIGWVLEADGGAIAGWIGNIHMLYELDGRPVRAAIASTWAVDAAYRGKALRLATTFFSQRGPDLWLNGSASPTASRVLSGLRIPRIPLPSYNVPCFWAANPTGFAAAILRRKRVPAPRMLARPAGLALLISDIATGSGRGKPVSALHQVPTFDDRFDALWQRIAAGPPRLRAVRSRAMLDWRFGGDVAAGRAAILTAGSGHDLLGYIVLVRRGGSELGMSLYDVGDLQAAGDDPAVYRDLLLGAVRLARERGADAVKLLTGTPAKRAPAEALRPHTYQLPFWQLYYKASPALDTALASADAWDFSPFDTY